MNHPIPPTAHFAFGVSYQISKSVFRFFESNEHAEALLRGAVWISTLNACRAYEENGRGDKGEGSLDYRIKQAEGIGRDPDFRTVAERAGIGVSEGARVTLSNISRRMQLTDAYVLCTTMEHSPENLSSTFGSHCIEILDSAHFFKLITHRLNSLIPLNEALLGPVRYTPRQYAGLEEVPGPLGFVKPPDLFEVQKEFRMLWVPHDLSNLKPFLLNAPEIRYLVRRA